MVRRSKCVFLAPHGECGPGLPRLLEGAAIQGLSNETFRTAKQLQLFLRGESSERGREEAESNFQGALFRMRHGGGRGLRVTRFQDHLLSASLLLARAIVVGAGL